MSPIGSGDPIGTRVGVVGCLGYVFDGGSKFRMHCTTIFDGKGKDLEGVGDGDQIPVPVFFKGALVGCVPLLAGSFRGVFAGNTGSGIEGN